MNALLRVVEKKEKIMENGKNTALKSSWAAAFTVASVWFGTHVGGGFATGNQVIGYFVQYGWTAVIWPILSMALLAVVMYVIARFARLRGLTNYKDTFRELWNPYPQMEFTFELFYVVIILAAVAAAVSGAANLIVSATGLPYIVCCALTIAVLVVLSIFGIKLIIAVSTFLSAAILVIVAVMVVVGLTNSPNGLLGGFAAEGVYNENAWEAFYRGIPVYAGFQCVSIPSFIAASTTVTNNKGVKKAAVLGGLMNGLALAASGFMLIAWYPQIMEALPVALENIANGVAATNPRTMPNLWICQTIGWNWMTVIYSLLLFCAFVSTSVTLLYSMIDRFEGKLPESVPGTARKVIVGAIVLALCFGVSLMGLTNIINKVYGYCGYFAIVFVMLPVLILGIKKNKQWVAEHPNCLDD